MSGILGILGAFDKDGLQCSLKAMRDAMAFWGPDGSRLWQNGRVGFGHLRLIVTPESRHELQPKTSPCGGYTITAQGRIDNRSELLACFEVPSGAWEVTPDNDLMLWAYQKWGSACCPHLMGDWSFAVWDQRKNGVFLARDQYGNASMYYAWVENGFLFGSSMHAILAYPGMQKKLDEEFLSCLFYRLTPQDSNRTIYSNVLRLPPGHCLWVNGHNLNHSLDRYWDPVCRSPIRYGCLKEYYEHFEHVFDQAVQSRLRSLKPVALSLSGGLDSSTVAAFAVHRLRQQGKTLTAYSYVPKCRIDTRIGDRIADEGPLVKKTVDHLKYLELDWIRDSRIPLFEIHDMALSILGANLLMIPSANLWWIFERHLRSAQRGIGVMLSAAFGNLSISYPGKERVWSLLAEGAYQTAWSELGWYRRRKNLSWYRAVRHLLLGPLVAKVKQRFFKKVLFSKLYKATLPMSPAFAARMNIRDRFLGIPFPFTRLSMHDTRHNRLLKIDPLQDQTCGKVNDLFAWAGQDFRDPTQDIRVIEFCLNVPDDLFFQNGCDRALVRYGLRGKLPDEVLRSSVRGMQGIDIAWRVYEDRARIAEQIGRISRHESVCAYLDVARLKKLLDSLGRGPIDLKKHLEALSVLQGLNIGMFLARWDDHPAFPLRIIP